MFQKLATAAAVLAVTGALVFWFLSAPQPLDAGALPNHEPDLANGELVFNAGGCSSCHAAKGARGDDKLVLTGGLELDTPFGIFRVPNISADPDQGIGGWSALEFVNAMKRGVSPGGSHYYPAFPYASYARATLEDLIDMKAYLDTLPASDNQVADHSLPFPFSVRRGLGLWKLLYLNEEPRVVLDNPPEPVLRGQYLVEGLGHCGECHTPRNLAGGFLPDTWLSGAPNPDGEGRIPNITAHADGLGSWSAGDISYYLESGFTPEFDSVGGSMVAVQDNMAKLPPEDREAIAAYLKAVPARAKGK